MRQLLLGFVLVGCSGTDMVQAPQSRVLTFEGIPYLETSVPQPRRTIIFIHGGPEVPALQASPFERWLAQRYKARVLKLAYYGSSERSAWSRPPSVQLAPGTSARAARTQLLRAITTTYAGMPQAVVETRRFIAAHKVENPVIIGESHGALMAPLASKGLQYDRMILVAPVLASQQELVSHALAGRPAAGVSRDPVSVNSVHREAEAALFRTPAEQRALEVAVSLAYYRPWESVTLADLLPRQPARIAVVYGGKDDVAVSDEAQRARFEQQVPKSVLRCKAPNYGHAPPEQDAEAAGCMDRFMSDEWPKHSDLAPSE